MLRHRNHALRPNDAAAPAPGDAEILEHTLVEYWRPLVAYTHRLLGDPAAAEDVVQQAFVRLWEREHTLPAGREVRPFLYRIVRNLAANEWRRSRTHARWVEEQGWNDETSIPADAAVEALELQAAVDVAVDRLPARRREVFVLSRFHGLTNDEIAGVVGISRQTVANQLVSALRTLRELLRPQLEAHGYASLHVVRDEDLTTR